MAENEKAKVGRLQKRRETQQAKHERTGDTPQAEAEKRRKQDKDYDADEMKRRVGNPGATFFS
jgi:hypothetical protein